MSGSSGTAGASGSSGAAGMSGAGGDAGMGGTAGMAGDAGMGGTGAISGAGGMAGAPASPKQCVHHCTTNADCEVGGIPQLGVSCVGGTCVQGSATCSVDADCVPQQSNWVEACTADADCTNAQQVCIDVGGGDGRCASPTTFVAGCLLYPDTLTYPKREDPKQMVEVCGNGSYLCDAGSGTCSPPCTTNTDCLLVPNSSVCDVDTGLCGCASDDDCVEAGVSTCNLATHRCECASNADCDGLGNADVCVGGRCGCSDANVCPAIFDAATVTCE